MIRRPRIWGLAVVFLVAAGALVLSGMAGKPAHLVPREVVGPLLGHTTPTSARVWMWAGPRARFSIQWAEDRHGAPWRSLSFVADSRQGNRAMAFLKGLKPATAYVYEVTPLARSLQVDAGLLQGKFRTPNEDATPSRFTMAVASCMKPHYPHQDSWYLLMAQDPEFQLFLGDNIYADSTDPYVLWREHLRYRSINQFATAIRNVPTYAMWDDHDYGPNDSDRNAVGKERSLQAFTELWANPSAGTAETPGAFFSFVKGEVEFFVLDGRYHRSPNDAPDDSEKRMLGDAQFEWLRKGLINSTAKFKVLASGSTFMECPQDGWSRYSYSRRRLFSLIAEERIDGVIYLSGDLHHTVLRSHESTDPRGYPLHEVISSGIAGAQERGFATLTFDTTLEDPVILIKTIFGDGAVHAEKTLRLSEICVRPDLIVR